jgi:hypothetical protein
MRMTLAAIGLVLATGSAYAAPQSVTYALGTNDPEVRALAERGVQMLVPERACEGAVLVRRDFRHGSTQDPAFRYECRNLDRNAVVSLDANAIRAFDPTKPQSTDFFGNRSLDSQR